MSFTTEVRRPGVERALAIALFAALTAGTTPLLLQGFFHDDFGEVWMAARSVGLDVFRPGNEQVAEHYEPLRKLVFAALYSLAGARPWLYHLLSLAMHTTAAVAWFRIASIAIPERLLCLIATAFYFYIPFPSESVFWISANDQVIGSATSLWSLWAYLRYGTTGKAWQLCLSLSLFTAGLLVSESVAPLLLILCFAHFANPTPGSPAQMPSMKALVPYVLAFAAYAVLHVLAVDTALLRSTGVELAIGSHIPRNLMFGICVSVFVTAFPILGSQEIYPVIFEFASGSGVQMLCALACLPGLLWKKTRFFVACFIFATAPYTVRYWPPQAPRYFRQPSAFLLLVVMICVYWIGVKAPRTKPVMLAVLLLGSLAALRTWHTKEYAYYEGQCMLAEAALERIATRLPSRMEPDMIVEVFNDLPFPIRHSVGFGMELYMERSGMDVRPVEYFRGLREYRIVRGQRCGPAHEIHVPLDLILIPRVGHESPYDQDSAGGNPRPEADHADGEITWDLKLPFPGFLVVEAGREIEDPEAQMLPVGGAATITIDEYTDEDGVSGPARSLTYEVSSGARRVRLPRPLNPRGWARLRLHGGGSSHAALRYLALEAL